MRSIIIIPFLLALAVPAAAQEVQPAPAASVDADRFVLLEGGRNFRDIGGYRTVDGHVVKRGMLYRSGSLGGLTPAGRAKLEELGIVSIVDLRTTLERSRDTNDLRAGYGAAYWTRDYDLSVGSMGTFFSDPANLTRDRMRDMMAGAYRTMPMEQAPAYREMFARLRSVGGPQVVNCTAGKDRTGIASALVLTALGVPYETVRQDFLLSNGAPGMDTLQGQLSGPIAKLSPDLVQPIVGVDGIYLDNAFDQLRRDYGSVEGYLERELGVGPAEIAALRARMLD